MKEFNYYQPTDIKFGQGRVGEIGQIVSEWGKRCLLVTVPIFPDFEGLIRKVKQSLEESGIAVAHFDEVIPNPTTEVVSDGTRMARSHNADVVIGLGGGSSMDTAKAIAVEATHEGTCWDYLFFRDTQPTEKTLPVITITTTSGTGSQVTQVAVVTNPAEKNKSALYHPLIFPKVSIVDPELMVTVPKHITASTGFDVFAHAFESYLNLNGSPYTDLMSVEAIRLVAAHLPQAVKNGEDKEARTLMAWADTLAGLSIANAGVTLPHGIGMAIGGNYPHVKHGEALAVVYPAILRYTYRAAPGKFARVTNLFNPSMKNLPDEEAAARFCSIMEDFLKEIGMSFCFEDLKVPKEELRALAEA
ncbi:MAG: iron-containing alcohol dehydrogenase, partial [Deltaproteobacteria bacterium]|nr:iron-containing alcohol dehydrogenase [Deltaproteobacteria bacterium]